MATPVQEKSMEHDTVLTVDEAAAQLRVKESWLYRAARDGTFPSIRVGRYVRFRQQDVTDWIRTGGRVNER